MATEVQSTNRYTSRKVEVDGITLYDSEARFRKNFLKKHLKNTVDVVRFSYMMGQLAVKPIIGPLIRKSLELHYRYIHTNSVVVPIEVAKDIIRNTTDIAVSPCVCRTVRGNCDNPINTCCCLAAGAHADRFPPCVGALPADHLRRRVDGVWGSRGDVSVHRRGGQARGQPCRSAGSGRKSGRRDAVRVLCNVGVGALAMALYLMS